MIHLLMCTLTSNGLTTLLGIYKGEGLLTQKHSLFIFQLLPQLFCLLFFSCSWNNNEAGRKFEQHTWDQSSKYLQIWRGKRISALKDGLDCFTLLLLGTLYLIL